MNSAQMVSRFAQSNHDSKAGYTAEEQREMNRKFARANGGKPRTVKGKTIGYRFADGSAVTADNFVEFLGSFASEKGTI